LSHVLHLGPEFYTTKSVEITQNKYRQKYVHKQAKMESQRNVAYSKNRKIIKCNRHLDQHNTDNGGQAMGEEMRHVQMSR